MSGNDIRAGGAFIEVFAKNESLKKGLEESKKLLSNFRQSVDRVGSLTGRIFGGTSTNLGKGIQNAFSGVGAALEKGFNRSVAGSRLFIEGLRSVELKMRNFSVSARNLGLDLIKLGVVLGTPIAFGVKQFADFEKAMAKVSTFLEKPEKLMPQFKAEIKALSEEFGTSMTDIANGLSEVLSAGIPASKAMSFVKDSLKGAIGNVVDFKDQMSLLITVMQAYEGSNLTTAKATEILRVIVEKGRIPADQLARSFGQVVSGAANAGVSFEETAAAMSAMSLTGLTVAEQTTALNGVINSFSSAAPEAAEAFVKLNKALGNSSDPMTIATLRAKGLTGVLEELSALSPDDLGAIFKETRAGRGITILVAKMKEYKDALAQARSGGNLADTSLQKMLSTLSHLGDKLLQIGKNLAVTLGDALLSSLTSAANALIEIGKLISEFIKNNPTLVLTLAKVTGAILAAGAAFVSLGLAFSVASTVLSGFVAVGSLVIDAVVAVGSALAGLFLFFTSGTGIIVAFGVALSSTFIDFGSIFDDLVSGVKNSFNAISSIFGNFKDSIVSAFNLVKRAVAAKDYDLAVRIAVNKIQTIWYETVNNIKKKYEELKTAFVAKFKEMYDLFSEWIKGIMNGLSDLTGLSIFSDLAELFGDMFSEMDGSLAGFAKTWVKIWATMQGFSLSVIETVRNAWAELTIANAEAALKVTGGRSEGDVITARMDVIDAVGGGAENQRIVDDLSRTITKMEKLQEMLDSGATGHAKESAEGLLEGYKDDVNIIKNQLASKMGNLLERDYFKSVTFPKAFNPLSKNEKEGQKLIADTTSAQAQSKTDTAAALAKIESDKNTKIDEINTKNAKPSPPTAEELRLQKLNESWGNVGDPTQRRLNALALKNRQDDMDLQVAEFKKASIDLFNPVKEALMGAWDSIINPKGDAIVDNNKPDQNLMLKEEKKIRDGIMGAFNTNALGDFSKGDVMKSIAELQKETNERLKMLEDLQKQSLVPAKETANNTKGKALFK